MKIQGAKPVDLALFLKKEKALIIGDIHIGFDEAMQKQGVFLPKFHFQDLILRLKKIIEQTKPNKIIINGDIKHEFGTITNEEWRNILKLIDELKKDHELILIKGNHDKTTEPIAKKRELKLQKFAKIEDTYVCHGHKMPTGEEYANSKTVILSHDHPAIGLKDGQRIEKYKCFLFGNYEGKKIIVLPAFSPTATGSDVLKDKMMSPFLKNIEEFEVIVSEQGKLYDFGTVNNLNLKTNKR